MLGFGIKGDKKDPIEGTWALVEGTYFGEERSGDVFQYKIYHDGHFILIMQNKQTGAWDHTSYGTYTVDEDQYSETFIKSNVPQYVGVTATWDFWFEGDRFVKKGPTKLENQHGEPALQDLMNQMYEERVRAQ